MIDDNDPDSGFAVGFAIAVAIFVALFSVGVALSVTSAQRPVTAASTAPLAPIKLYFESGQDRLPDEAAARLASLIAVANADAGARLVITAYHEKSGDASFNADLARQRAYAVRDFLRAAGIADERIALAEPLQAPDGADDREARRVEVMLQ